MRRMTFCRSLLSLVVAAATTITLLGQQAGPTSEAARVDALVRAYQAQERTATSASGPKPGLAVDRGPSGTPAEAQAHADRAAALVKQLATVDVTRLTHDEWIVYGITRYDAEMEAENGASFFWLTPVVTPYSSPMRTLAAPFTAAPLKTPADLDAYVAALNAIPSTMQAYVERLREQLDHGVALPVDELPLVLPFVRGFEVAPPDSPFSVNVSRLGAFAPEEIGRAHV